MSKTIADLALQLRKANTKLAEAQSSIATLTSKLSKTGAKPKRFSTSPTTAMSSSRYNNRFLKDGYCWSQGFQVTHNSTTCKNNKSGHMTAATRSDTMGRKMWNKSWDERKYKWRRVCDKLDYEYINIIETRDNFTYKHVDNLAAEESGTSGHFLKSNSPCVNKIIATNPLGIRMPNGHMRMPSGFVAILLSTQGL